MSTRKIKQIRSLRDLKADPRNANKHTEHGMAAMRDSITECGFGDSLTVDKHGAIISGNARTDILNGQAGAPIVVQSDGTRPVIHQRIDLDLSKDAKAKRLAVFQNRVGELNLEWDLDVLGELDAAGQLAGLFDADELAALQADLARGIDNVDTPERDAEPDTDRIAELQKQWKVKPGELWTLGRHRLLCGDATNQADVARLLAGSEPGLMVTDPPYGVNYDPTWREGVGGDFGDQPTVMRGKVANDDKADWTEAYQLFPGDVVYVWHAGIYAGELAFQLAAADFQIRYQIIWAKQHFALSRGAYHWQHEPAWFAVRKGATANWIGDRSQTTLWEIESFIPGGSRAKEERLGHGTQKPLECHARAIRNHSGDVYDPFAGTGTSIVAAQNLNRTCYALEIEPKYCALILDRIARAFPELEIARG